MVLGPRIGLPRMMHSFAWAWTMSNHIFIWINFYFGKNQPHHAQLTLTHKGVLLNFVTYLNHAPILSGIWLGVSTKTNTKRTHVWKKLDYGLKICWAFKASYIAVIVGEPIQPTRIFNSNMNKIFIWASRFVRKVARPLFGFYKPSHTN